MSRSRIASAGLAVLLSLALAGTAFAKGPHTKGPKKDARVRPAAEKQVTTTSAGEPWLKAKGNAAQLGGVLRLNVVLHAARDDRPDTCDAIVHLASDVTVQLMQQGGGAAYHASVPVGEAETPGPVAFDVTCLAGAATVTGTGMGKIQAGGETAETTESTEAPESPDATDANVVVPNLEGLTQEQRQALFDQLVALLARLLGLSPSGSTA